jgi:hypothetical protein
LIAAPMLCINLNSFARARCSISPDDTAFSFIVFKSDLPIPLDPAARNSIAVAVKVASE